MRLTGGNLNVKNIPIDEDGRDWSNGLCDFSKACKSLNAIKLHSPPHISLATPILFEIQAYVPVAALVSSMLKTNVATTT